MKVSTKCIVFTQIILNVKICDCFNILQDKLLQELNPHSIAIFISNSSNAANFHSSQQNIYDFPSTIYIHIVII